MAKYLRQSTASQEILLGPFVDSTDGVTAETALTINNTDIKIHKAGATTLANKNSGGGTHISNGNYYAVLDATDTDTAGNLNVVVQVSGALAFRDSYVVLPEYVYDSMLAPTAITGGYGPNGVVDSGTLQSATGTTAVLRSAASFADDRLNGMTIVITGGTGVGQARVITDYVNTTDTATVDTWTTTPDNTSTYIVLATPPASATAVPAVNVTQWNGSAVATPTVAGVPEVDVTHFNGTAGTFASGRPEVNTTHAAGTAWNSGAITANTLAADTITAAKVAADVTTEIQSGLATASALSTVAGYLDTEVAAILAAVDTEVAAIKAKTDSLTFTVAGQVDANIQSINDTTITGNGSAPTKFGV